MFNNLNQVPGGSFVLKLHLNEIEWTKFPVKSLPNGVSYTRAVLFGQYLIVLTHARNSGTDSKDRPQASLLAVCLEDKSVEEAQIDKDIFCYHDDYTFTKYGDNQIIKFGGAEQNQITGKMTRITIKSFKPFLVELEEIPNSSMTLMKRLHTAQICKDLLYVFGGRSGGYLMSPDNTTWSFNLRSHEWKKCTINDQKLDENDGGVKEFSDGKNRDYSQHPGARDRPSSFLINDRLYIYGGDSLRGGDWKDLKDIFALTPNAMVWKKLEQRETFLAQDIFPEGTQLNGDLYHDHLIFLGGDEYSDNVLFCWNHRNNYWSTFKIESLGLTQKSNLIVSDDLLLVLGEDKQGLSLATFNLENIMPGLEKAEKELLSPFFMSEGKSDIQIKVDGFFLPAHKSILKKKSRFFANLPESNMIEIQDCDYLVFREFLKFLYCGKVDFNEDVDFALKLLKLANTDLEENFKILCLDFLKFQIGSNNFFTILNFAREKNLPELEEMCKGKFSHLLNRGSYVNWIECLDQQERSEFVERNVEFRNQIFDFVLENFRWMKPEEKGDLKFLENFLIQNMKKEKIGELVKFLDGLKVCWDQLNSESFPTNLQESVLNFVQKNLEEPPIIDFKKNCSKKFLLGLVSFMARKLRNFEDVAVKSEPNIKKEEDDDTKVKIEGDSELRMKEESQPPPQRILKRKEPGKENRPEEMPELKKTKKTFYTNKRI